MKINEKVATKCNFLLLFFNYYSDYLLFIYNLNNNNNIMTKL